MLQRVFGNWRCDSGFCDGSSVEVLDGPDARHRRFILGMIVVSHACRMQSINGIIVLASVGERTAWIEIGINEDGVENRHNTRHRWLWRQRTYRCLDFGKRGNYGR